MLEGGGGFKLEAEEGPVTGGSEGGTLVEE